MGRGGIEQGERIAIGEGPVELRVLKAREFYEVRGGCKCSSLSLIGRDWWRRCGYG